MSTTQVKVLVPDNRLMVSLLGHRDELLRLIEAAFGDAEILVRGNEITVTGVDADRVGRLFEELVVLLRQGHRLDAADVSRTIEMAKADERPSVVMGAEVLRSGRGRTVRPKTSGQRSYVDAIAANVVTFGIGPAGTGKSYLAVALAVQALNVGTVSRIILTRIGFGSKAVVTGDVTQVDLAAGRSGLLNLENVLTGIDGVRFVHLSSRDVVRHRIVADIVDAYERAAT